MQAVFDAALPIFALIGTGYLCGRYGVFSREASDSLNRFAIYLALPALIFTVMSRITPDQVRQVGYSLAFGGGIAVTAGLGLALSLWRRRSLAGASLEGLDAGYGNVGFMGIPLCLLVFGQEGVPPAIIATLLTACVLFLSAIVLIEIDLQKDVHVGRMARKILLALVRNPLLVAPVAGLCLGLGGLGLPAPVERFTSLLGGAASPCALICIGLFLAQERLVVEDVPTIATLVALKLFVQPAATALLVVYVFDMPPLWRNAAILLAALPIGSGPFTIAKLYRLPAAATSGAILVSHVVSVVTVSLLVAWLG